MLKPLEFADQLRKQWGTIVTSGAFIGGLGIWQGLGHPVAHGFYWGVALVGFVTASYRAWLRESERLEAEKLESARLRSVPRRDWAGDWKELADRFKPYVGSGIRADWQHSSFNGTDIWRICGGTNEVEKNCRALCKLGAALLSACPGVGQGLPETVRSEKDELNKWLYFLKETESLTGTNYGFEVAQDGKEFLMTFGSISDLAGVSARACIECATHAFANLGPNSGPDNATGRK